ncbi:MAG: twitching motility protein PilT [Chloroflexi bacterium RBG_16_58_14]|nr:MAG: twitching motility protein PilT [Chloroflexi bacterium RBG_16_58_14]
MTLRYLLDTNVISEPLRAAPSPAVLEKLRLNEEFLAISAITWHELWFGCRRLPDSARRSAIESFLLAVIAPAMPILPYDEGAAAWHAAERARLAAQGHTPPFADGQIAAIAHQHQLTLVTFNMADYQGFHEIPLEDWRS